MLPISLTNSQLKAQQRQLLRQRRQSLTTTQRKHATLQCNRYLYQVIKRHKRIGVYWAVGSELSLLPLIKMAQRRGANIYLPYIEPQQRRLWFSPCPKLIGQTRHVRQSGLPKRSNHWGIPQFAGHKFRVHHLHSLILPLVGVDQEGHRLGQGGGFYDVTLAHSRYRHQPKLIGAGFACQQVTALTYEAHDYPLNAFVCETGWQIFTH